MKSTSQPPTQRNTNAIWMDLFHGLNLQDARCPNNLKEVEQLALTVKDAWESNGRRPLVAAHRSLDLISNQLMRLRSAGGINHEMAGRLVTKLADCASKDLKRHDLFDEVLGRMNRAVAPKP